ncbi:MAG: hypothetical protein VX188_02250 [Candidatus Thermoplasmatota archaeon]|nr:hypothetical protein [Candidatus Thermoplasmatota archaeon]
MTGIMKLPWGCLLIVALFLQPLAVGEIDEYVSHPGNIPDFHNFSTPQLEPGQEGEFSLDIHNRYDDSLENAVIVAEIYHRADIDESESLDEIPSKERPYIRETCWSSGQDENENCIATTDSRKATFDIGTIEFNETISLEFEVQSKEDTKEGTYFVRFSMNFDYNSTARVMQSRGYWSMEQWEDATTNVTEGAPGNINLEVLEVDGIIPDSSFGIKKPIPLWPLYVLITLTVLFAGLSVVFYLEEEGNYPELNKWLQKQRGKFNQLRLRFKYRKGG